ncbi:MAG: hypothetical protein QF682_10750 [Candidatus Thermoplasmatota archaeon]|nr:hypothetical protein [Candidatus Thermoplasmatota archaeon]
MEAKSRYIGIALIIVILVCLGVITFIFLDEGEDPPSDNTFDDVWYPDYRPDTGPPESYFVAGVHEMQLNISEKGFGLLIFEPFTSEGVIVSGNVTFNNITVIPDINGTAVFNVTYPIESGEYDVFFEYKDGSIILRIDLKVIKD